MNTTTDRYVLQNAATTTGNGNVFMVGRNDQITIYITGTATSSTVVFEGLDADGNVYSAPAFKMPDYTLASQTTGKNEAWVIDLSKWYSIRTRISAINGGNITITGKIVRMSN